MAQTVIGFFDNPSEAQNAVQQLESIGISRQNIDVSSGGSTNVSGDTSGSADYSSDRSRDRDNDNRGNAISRFFSSLFGDDDNDADRYSNVARSAQSIVTVHAQSDDDAERAADILDDCGAIDVDERSAQHGYARTGQSRDSSYSSDSSDTSRSDRRGDDDTTIERIEENLEIGKREVERGGVRVRSRIVERPVEETVRLREEHVHVERNPVNRSISGDELANFEERDIELTERAEVPVVNKEARVVEEIRISKDTEQREETVRDTVRSTEVDVDNIDTKDRDTNYNRGNSDLDDDGDLGTDNRTGGRTTF